MKHTVLIISTLLLAGAVFAQEPVCDCADCREKAAAAAAGKEFTLSGLQELNRQHTCEEGHDHGPAEVSALHEEHEHEEHEHEDAVEQPVLPIQAEHNGCSHDEGGPATEGVELSADAAEKAGIKLANAQGGTVARSSTFPAEIQMNRDRTSAVSPRYPSVVRQVFAELGDDVKEGDVLASLENRETLAVYTMSAPIAGVIIHKDLAVGETVSEGSTLFTVADLSSVWVDIHIFPQYQRQIHPGMPVTLIAHDGDAAQGTVKYISPILSKETRTLVARCVLEDPGADFTPGAFVRARIVTEHVDAPVVVPCEAVQVIDGEAVVFIPGEHGFVATPVQTGLMDNAGVEIRRGLKPGDQYVADGAFALKAQLVTSGMDPHAGHGH